MNIPCGKESAEVQITKNKGKEKIEEISIGKAHANTLKLNQNISTVTDLFLNQKKVNVCEHTTKMASLEEWMEGNLKGNYLRLILGLCLEDRTN